jgi:hypothetical protein
MRSLVLAVAFAAAVAGGSAATAEELQPSSPAPALIECSRDAQFRRAIRREYGRLEYVTAAQVLAARKERAGWSGTRCMSGLESWRLDRALAREAQPKLQLARR